MIHAIGRISETIDAIVTCNISNNWAIFFCTRRYKQHFSHFPNKETVYLKPILPLLFFEHGYLA